MDNLRDLALSIQTAWAEPNQPQSLLDRARDAFAALTGHRLFTVTRIRPGGKEIERLYSTNEAVYPVGGRKAVTQDEYDTSVNEGKRPFLARTPAEFADFPDHDVIVGLGLGSVMSLPVLYDGRVLGTLNLLDREGAYDSHQLGPAMLLAQQALPAFLGV